MARLDHDALRRRVHIAQILLIVILVGGAALVARLIVAGPIFTHTTRVTLDLPSAAGLHPRSDVAYRGQHIGSVTSISLTPEGVRATLSINGDVQVPVDTDVVVADLSAVGEQYVDFRPRTGTGPYLENGSALIGTAADLPVPTWQVLSHVQGLLSQIKSSDIDVIGREVRAIFAGGGVDLNALVTQAQATISMVQQITPTTLSLLTDVNRPLHTFANLSPAVVALMKNSRAITAQLRASDPTIATLLDQGAVVIPVLVKDFDATSPVLVQLLDDGTPVAAMARAHIPGLLHWFQWGPQQLQAMSAALSGHTARVILAFTTANNCLYSAQISPFQHTAPLPLSARCTSTDPHVQQRGSQNVPVQ